jgi:valyl-tRNA synthetase
MKTVTQLALEYGVSVQAVRKRLKRLATRLPTGTTEKIGGALYINPDAERLIMEGLQPTNAAVGNLVANQNNQVANQKTLYIEDSFNMVLTEQLKAKDAQIEELMKQNAALIKEIENFQMLLRNEQMIKALPVPVGESEQPTPIIQRAGFLQRFFKRR